MLGFWIYIRMWIITTLGGCVTHHSPAFAMEVLWESFDSGTRDAVRRACQKVAIDPGFSSYAGTNLGRNILRDEACEWAKLYIKDLGLPYHDSQVHLACEIYYHRYLKGA